MRQTCWRLCNASFHLLSPYVTFRPEPYSLSNFQNLTCHPTISKGIQAVRVGLDFYESLLAVNMQKFAYNTARLRHIIFNMQKEAELAPEELKESVRAALEKFNAIHFSWKSFTEIEAQYSSPIPRSADFHSHVLLLQRAQIEYHQCYLEQRMLIDTGTFVQAVAAAFSRMLTARFLELSDRHTRSFERIRTFFVPSQNMYMLFRNIVQPMS